MQNNNSSISQDMNRIFDLKGESTNLISDMIMPVVNVQRTLDLNKTQTRTTTGASTVFTSAADKDTYITSIQFSYVKTVLCDVANGNIQVTAVINGLTSTLIALPIITLNADNMTTTFNFQLPLKIDRNSIVSSSGTFTAGVLVRTTVIHGYTVETTK